MMEIDRRSLLAGVSAIAAFPAFIAPAAAATPVRMTSIKFGSVSWLIETIRAQGLDKKHGLDLQVSGGRGGHRRSRRAAWLAKLT